MTCVTCVTCVTCTLQAAFQRRSLPVEEEYPPLDDASSMMRLLTNEHLPLAQPRRVAVLLAGCLLPVSRHTRHTQHMSTIFPATGEVRDVFIHWHGVAESINRSHATPHTS